MRDAPTGYRGRIPRSQIPHTATGAPPREAAPGGRATTADVERRPGGDVTSRLRPRRLRDVDPTRRSIVLAWWAFTITFALARLTTWLIKIDVGGIGDVSAGGLHIHHYVWGIVLVAGVAAAAMGDHGPKVRALLGVLYGVGMALIIDEAALLVSLEDVYWDTWGATSVALALIVIGGVGATLAGTRPDHRRSDRAR
jgi:hypothetical protein